VAGKASPWPLKASSELPDLTVFRPCMAVGHLSPSVASRDYASDGEFFSGDRRVRSDIERYETARDEHGI
jgi:hypothetical protein